MINDGIFVVKASGEIRINTIVAMFLAFEYCMVKMFMLSGFLSNAHSSKRTTGQWKTTRRRLHLSFVRLKANLACAQSCSCTYMNTHCVYVSMLPDKLSHINCLCNRTGIKLSIECDRERSDAFFANEI